MRSKQKYVNPSKYPDMFNHESLESKLDFIKEYLSDNSNIDNYLVDSLYWEIKCSKSSRQKIEEHVDQPIYADRLKHKQVHIFNPFYNEIINVDEKLEKLLTRLWANEISTDNSCESNVPDDYIWISFSSLYHFEQFMEKIIGWLRLNKSELIDRVLGHNNKCDGSWDYKLSMYDEDDFFDVSCAVRFPWYDLKWVEKIFKN